MAVSVTYPAPLRPGRTVAFVSPASAVKAEFVEGTKMRLEKRGFKVKVMPHAVGDPCGSYSASEEERLRDLTEAWRDPEVGAVICTRGGYGCVHLLDSLGDDMLRSRPKWLVGFSDVSALHARLLAAGVSSVHGSMARYIADPEGGEGVLDALLGILCAYRPEMDYRFAPDPLNGKPGTARGELRGGNLAVLSHLIGTPYDIFAGDGHILFIEDVSEAIYATERMLWQLRLTGALDRAKGLIVGRFTDTKADRNFPDTATMIHHRLKEWGVLDRIPVAFGAPVGHIPANVPLIQGAQVELAVGDNDITLRTTDL